ncbi:ancient ubiquitous protein 1 isoform X1 [Monodon monoceros]|uniref:ancient ubiquitous protein 1 isoform X1 n=1 Tax=Monodon monoceros TaxID=40151 RepID=UPI0010F73648|nr:ancient ubiquitous protein 1 isoform X1 [Monodon monoceros]
MEPPPSPGPERLFDSHRLPGDGFLLLALLLYAPVGFCLLVLRVFLGIHVFLVSCALPDSVLRRFVVRTMCAVLGLVARQEDSGLRDHRVRILISNHVTPFDHNIVNLLTSCSTFLAIFYPGCGTASYPASPETPSFCDGVRCLLGLRTAVVTFRPFHGVSSKVLTVLTFWWLGETRLKVKEVVASALSICRSFNIKVLHHRGNIKYLLSPLSSPPLFQEKRYQSGEWVPPTWSWVVFFRWLRPVHRQLGEGSEEFSLRVQQLVAKELGQTGTQLTPADKAEHMKRQRHPRLRPQSAQSSFPPSPGPSPDVQLTTLAQRVKEVLPHVPLGVIQRDLGMRKGRLTTGCVDLTITNLLEGAVTFMPEDITERTQALPTASTPKFPSSGPVTPQPTALTFAKSSWARQENLQERKQALYEYARRRFTERQAQEAD